MAAYAIRRKHGHAVLVDWPEMPFMKLPMVRNGRPGWWRRLSSYHLLQDEHELAQLGRYRTIDIRGMSSISYPLIEQEIQAQGSRIGPTRSLAQSMAAVLAGLQGKPVVGIHVRQGDFIAGGDNNYRAQDGRHTRVPAWWYQYIMDQLVTAIPGVIFLWCINGEQSPMQALIDTHHGLVCDFAFDFELPRPGHKSQSNPVADLFALASCSLILGTPASSFSHWAASNLGPSSTVISPTLAMGRESPAFRLSTFRHRPLGDWVHFSWRDASQSDMKRWDPATPCKGFDTQWWFAPAPATP